MAASDSADEAVGGLLVPQDEANSLTLLSALLRVWEDQKETLGWEEGGSNVEGIMITSVRQELSQYAAIQQLKRKKFARLLQEAFLLPDGHPSKAALEHTPVDFLRYWSGMEMLILSARRVAVASGWQPAGDPEGSNKGNEDGIDLLRGIRAFRDAILRVAFKSSPPREALLASEVLCALQEAKSVSRLHNEYWDEIASGVSEPSGSAEGTVWHLWELASCVLDWVREFLDSVTTDEEEGEEETPSPRRKKGAGAVSDAPATDTENSHRACDTDVESSAISVADIPPRDTTSAPAPAPAAGPSSLSRFMATLAERSHKPTTQETTQRQQRHHTAAAPKPSRNASHATTEESPAPMKGWKVRAGVHHVAFLFGGRVHWAFTRLLTHGRRRAKTYGDGGGRGERGGMAAGRMASVGQMRSDGEASASDSYDECAAGPSQSQGHARHTAAAAAAAVAAVLEQAGVSGEQLQELWRRRTLLPLTLAESVTLCLRRYFGTWRTHSWRQLMTVASSQSAPSRLTAAKAPGGPGSPNRFAWAPPAVATDSPHPSSLSESSRHSSDERHQAAQPQQQHRTVGAEAGRDRMTRRSLEEELQILTANLFAGRGAGVGDGMPLIM
ncbi:unnamed protein product [Vitrella brassicaformis CCMP3155]|uniref:Uncharacterized protein n=1 Tax=Vitrella brassicaformis (strain CCMP3155) TaxID=1169540 RepID=A0A0G4F847_VITBC|nr:unnamed protein product [Vitrella brassicaformis CCMP3155]|eukprot:CEM08879.1 unnamed protein product [Vitrella brassicaformis CCMP3155]